MKNLINNEIWGKIDTLKKNIGQDYYSCVLFFNGTQNKKKKKNE